ncbi:MAG: RES family NAD+ phosphorylase [Capsulimonas sp.]|uniref:RES family NAD+ phosphorylase n=1 Tax=Capsulimonas sp. TaxID=2494211 RepID=UPI003265B679
MRRSLQQRVADTLPQAILFQDACFRNVSQHFANTRDIRSAKGSFITGGRYNHKGLFEALYLSCDIHTCLEETTKSTQRDGFEVARSLPRTIVAFSVKLQTVLDLTNSTVLHDINLSRSKLIKTDWEYLQEVEGKEALTQQIARFARECGFEAVLVPSAVTKGHNLVIFPDKLQAHSYFKVLNRRLLGPPRP